MKFGTVTPVLREEDMIGGFLDSWKVDVNIIIISDLSFQGNKLEHDKSEQIAIDKGAIVIRCKTSDQYEMRNLGMALASGLGMDYVFVPDVDFRIEQKVLSAYKNFIERVQVDIFYSKKLDFVGKYNYQVLAPRDKGGNTCLRVNLRFDNKDPHFNTPENRALRKWEYVPTEELGYIYHFSFVRSEQKIREKLLNYSHAKEVIPNWFDDVFKNINPKMKNVAPTVADDYTEIKVVEIPEEIKKTLPKEFL